MQLSPILPKKQMTEEDIKLHYIRNLVIPLPPLSEQIRIIAKLEQLLPLCEKLKNP